MEPDTIRTQLAPDVERYLADDWVDFPDLSTATAAEVRAHFAAMRTAVDVPDVAEVQGTSFPADHGEVGVRIYRASLDPDQPALVWFHGGGWVLGDLDTAELPARVLCAGAGCTVVSVDYRLAPETQFPGNYHDCVAGLDWVLANAGELRIDPDRLAVGGDSAGGNLAAAVALDARDRNVSLQGQLLIYPVTEPPSPDYGEVENGYGLEGQSMRWFWDLYALSVEDRADWRAVPSLADLTGVARAFVQTCGFDPLAAEGIRYAHALEAAGVRADVDHLPDAIHGVFAMPIPTGHRARGIAYTWLASIL